MRSRRWDELTIMQKIFVMLLASVQVSLAAAAWADLAQRQEGEVQGSKKKWAAVIAINFIGPILYFTRGRTPTVDTV